MSQLFSTFLSRSLRVSGLLSALHFENRSARIHFNQICDCVQSERRSYILNPQSFLKLQPSAVVVVYAFVRLYYRVLAEAITCMDAAAERGDMPF